MAFGGNVTGQRLASPYIEIWHIYITKNIRHMYSAMQNILEFAKKIEVSLEE